MSRRFRCFPLLFLFVCAFVSMQAQTAGNTGGTGSTAASTKPACGQTATENQQQQNGNFFHGKLLLVRLVYYKRREKAITIFFSQTPKTNKGIIIPAVVLLACLLSLHCVKYYLFGFDTPYRMI